MAQGENNRLLLIQLSIFTAFTLVHGRSLLQVPASQKTNDNDGQFLSDQHLSQQAINEGLVSDVQRKSIVQGQLVSSSESTWNAMSPKLRCGGDLMKLQLNGPDVGKVELCRDNAAPVQLTQLPSHCGHSSPFYGGLVYATPYDGCGVSQKGGQYLMHMLWHGVPAVMSCPSHPFATNDTAEPQSSGIVHILLPHSHESISPPNMDTPFQLPLDFSTPEATTVPEQSTTKFTDTAQANPQTPGYPYMFHPDFYNHYSPYLFLAGFHSKWQTGGAFAPTTTVEPAVKMQYPKPPFNYQMLWPYYQQYFQSPVGKRVVWPTKKLVGTVPTSKPTVVQAIQRLQQSQFWPFFYHGFPPSVPKVNPTKSMTTTSAPPFRHAYDNGMFFWPFHFHHHQHHSKPRREPYPFPIPTRLPPTTTTKAPAKKTQIPRYPELFWPYYGPQYQRPVWPKPTRRPTPAPTPRFPPKVVHAPKRPPVMHGYPEYPWPYFYPQFQQPGRPRPSKVRFPVVATTVKTTTRMLKPPGYYYPYYFQQFYPPYQVLPRKPPPGPPEATSTSSWITTTPQPCTTTSASECSPLAEQHPAKPYPYSPYEKDPFALNFVDFLEHGRRSYPFKT